MLPQYKLRLGDGTILVVDHDGLNTWVVDRKAMVQAEGSSRWYSLHEFLAAERVAARRAAKQKPSTRDALPLVPPPPKNEPVRKGGPLPLVPPPPKDQPIRKPEPAPAVTPPPSYEPQPLPPIAEAPLPSLAAAPREEPPSIGEPQQVQVLAADPGAGVVVGRVSVGPIAEEALPVVPLKPLAGSPRPAPIARPPDDSAPPIPLVPLEDAEPARPAPRPRADLNVLAADPFAAAGAAEPPVRADALAVIPFKPVEDQDASRSDVWSGERPEHEEPIDEQPGLALEIEEFLRHPAVAAVLRVASVLGTLLSRGLDAAGGLAGRWRSRRARAAGSGARGLGALLAGDAVASPRPEDSAERPWLGEPPSVPDEPPAWRAGPPPVVPKPPPRLEALPTLRLAEIEETEDLEELYDGEGAVAHRGSELLGALWLWTKRVVLIVVLAGGGILAAVTWQSWFPKAGEIGQVALTEIDRQARAADLAKQRQRALQEAGERLPQLAPETVRRLVWSRGDDSLEMAELLQSAEEAADRGRGALAAAEAQELEALYRELVAGLDPGDRDRVRDYDRARARGTVFATERAAVVGPLARGALALPEAKRERFQALLAKAIAAGLERPSGPEPGATKAP